MTATTALIIVGVLVLAAIVAAAGGFDRGRPSRRRTVVRDRPVDRVVEQPAAPVVEERATRRVVD